MSLVDREAAAWNAVNTCAKQIEDFLSYVFELEPEVHKHLSGDPFGFPEEAEQDVLCTDIIVV